MNDVSAETLTYLEGLSPQGVEPDIELARREARKTVRSVTEAIAGSAVGLYDLVDRPILELAGRAT